MYSSDDEVAQNLSELFEARLSLIERYEDYYEDYTDEDREAASEWLAFKEEEVEKMLTWHSYDID